MGGQSAASEYSIQWQVLTAGLVEAGRASSRRDRPLVLLLLRQYMVSCFGYAYGAGDQSPACRI